MKNKGFIPEKFYDKKQFYKNKKEKGILLMLLILNLFLLPITTKNIDQTKKVSIINKTNIENKRLNNEGFDNVNIWIENVLNDDIEEAYINKNKGEIVISSLENIDELIGNKFITISDMNLNDSGKYKLGVSLYE
jgi:hypothetical protein